MNWFKKIFVDLIVNVFIIIAVLFTEKWMEVSIIVYTGFLVITRIIVLSGNYSVNAKKKLKTEVPNWVYHVLYGFNFIFLTANQWWYTGLAWGIIWLLSWLTSRRINKAAVKS